MHSVSKLSPAKSTGSCTFATQARPEMMDGPSKKVKCRVVLKNSTATSDSTTILIGPGKHLGKSSFKDLEHSVGIF
jgi:hypothetical protein